MTDLRPATAKGARSSARVLRAATTVLARHGYGGASVAHIAEEAGVSKRNVLYYYGTREALLVEVVRTVGERMATHIDAVIETAGSAEALATALVDAMWSGVTSAPELARAYFALIGVGADAPVVEAALDDLKQAYLLVINRQLESIDPPDRHIDRDLDSIATLTLALLRGLLLEWTETGDTPRLSSALERFKHTIAAQLLDHPDPSPRSPR